MYDYFAIWFTGKNENIYVVRVNKNEYSHCNSLAEVATRVILCNVIGAERIDFEVEPIMSNNYLVLRAIFMNDIAQFSSVS